MASFLLINETTGCIRPVTKPEILGMIDSRFNPGGYTDVEHCMAMIEFPRQGGGYIGFPFMDRHSNRYTIQNAGLLDLEPQLRRKLRPADHRCTGLCLIPEAQREIIQVLRS